MRRLLERNRTRFWNSRSLLSRAELHQQIVHAIAAQQPFAVGRLGTVEASIVAWAQRMVIPGSGGLLTPLFSETSMGLTNAGLRPRTRASYRDYATLVWEALIALDLLGVWGSAKETIWMPHAPTLLLFDVEMTAPTLDDPRHWVKSLSGKRVLVVSPFQNTIQRQLPQFSEIWNGRDWPLDFEVIGVDFPYLIEDDCTETWQDVYARIGGLVQQGHYDVALFGCGGLGLPLTMLAKQAGKVGLHLGGHLQLLFGIHGKRHRDQPWHARAINGSWTNPDPTEIPKAAGNVEEGCYW